MLVQHPLLDVEAIDARNPNALITYVQVTTGEGERERERERENKAIFFLVQVMQLISSSM